MCDGKALLNAGKRTAFNAIIGRATGVDPFNAKPLPRTGWDGKPLPEGQIS